MRLKAPCLILLFYIKSVDLCTLDSGRCCHNYFRKNGICKECPPGTFGTDCSSKCPSGFFGKFCRQECLCNAHDCNSTYGCALTIGSPRSNYFVETTPLITLPTTSPLPWMSTTFVFVGFTAVLTVVLALYVLRTRAIQSKRGNGNTEETLVSYEVTNSQDIDNEVEENHVNALRVQHNHRISTAVPQLLKRCTSYKVYNRPWTEEAALSFEKESICEQDEYDECKPVDERSINDNLISDKPRKARSTQYKTVDKARVYPGSKLRPYSSVKHNRYSKNGRKNSQERGRETVCESSDLYDDAFSKIKGNDYEDIELVGRYGASYNEDKSDNKDCLTESNNSLTEEEEETISKDKDKNIVPLQKTDEGATENIYTSLDLNKCDKLDVNEYETERSTCYGNKSEANECTSHENQEKWSDSCSNCVLSPNGNYYEDIELVGRYEASYNEDKSDNKDCLTESNNSLTEEEEETISKDKDKNIVPLQKTDEGATENIYTSLDLNKCDKLDVNEYATERSTCYENEPKPNECISHENQEKWSDSCSNCVLSLNGNATFDASNEEDIE